MMWGPPWLDLCACLGQGGRRLARAAEQDGVGRCDLNFGETAVYPEQCAMVRALGGPRESVRAVWGTGSERRGRFGSAATMAPQRSTVCGKGAVHARDMPVDLL
jgi:hypothetical protein